MRPSPIIRVERPGDARAIADVVRDAFRGMPYAEGDEAELVDRLREGGALTLSLVAEVDGTVAGQAAFAPAISGDGAGGWFSLGPIAVLPALQRDGIGSALLRAGLDDLAARGARGCILVGDPRYYTRFGFVVSPAQCPHGQPEEYFQVKLLAGPLPASRFRFHPAFGEGAT